jgi:hypothetical protein
VLPLLVRQLVAIQAQGAQRAPHAAAAIQQRAVQDAGEGEGGVGCGGGRGAAPVVPELDDPAALATDKQE